MTMKSLYLAAVLAVVAAVPAYAGEGTCSGCPSKGGADNEMAAKKASKAAKADDKATSGAVVASAKK